MLPDFGKYAFSVLGAYTATTLLLIALVVYVILKNIRSRKVLKEAEEL